MHFRLHALATSALDSYSAERHDEHVQETAIQIARDWQRGRGTGVHIPKPKLARLAGLPGWLGRDLMSQLLDQTRSNEVKGREDRETVRVQANEWRIEPSQLHKGQHDDA